MNAYSVSTLPYFGYPDVPPDAYHGVRALVMARDNFLESFVIAATDERTIAEAIREEGVRLAGVGIILDCDTSPADYKNWRFVVAVTAGELMHGG